MKVLIFVFTISLVWPGISFAAEVIEPGEKRTFTTFDGGERRCRRGRADLATSFMDCRGARFIGTQQRLDKNRVRSRIRLGLAGPLAVSAGIPHYATASLYKDIHITGSGTNDRENHVLVQISTTYDYRNFLQMGAAYLLGSTFSVQVETDNGEVIATHTLKDVSRNAAQGFTDVALGIEREVDLNSTGSFMVLLRRGRDYRVTLEVEGLAMVPVAGGLAVNSRVEVRSLTVRVDEDEFDVFQRIRRFFSIGG